MQTEGFEDWLREHLVCPRDHTKLKYLRDQLICLHGHTYPIIDGIPILLLEDKISTQPEILGATYEMVKSFKLSREFHRECNSFKSNCHQVDPYVQKVIGAVCGRMFNRLTNKLSRYPIPELPLPNGDGRYLLDIGCNWGRWCISAFQSGYKTIGIDHNLDAIKAGVRVARQLGASVYYLVADARYLPFLKDSFDVVFSYSVMQHFNKDDVRLCLSEICQTLKMSGVCLIQMPNAFGLLNLYNQMKRRFKEPEGFDVRYWKPLELIQTFTNFIGSTSLFVDGFFSLNAQDAHKDILPFCYRLVMVCADRLKKVSKKIKLLKYCADSLYIKSTKI